MTIDSNMDHSITSASRYEETSAVDFEGEFNAFVDWCQRATGCALHGRDVGAVWDGLYAKAGQGKLTDPANGKPVGLEALRNIAFTAMYRPADRWPGMATKLAALADQKPGTAPLAIAPDRHADGELAANSNQAIWCEDWHWQVSGFTELDKIRKHLDQVAPHTHLTGFWTDVTNCLGWPAKVNNPQHKLSIHGGPKILMNASHFDVGTPRPWSLAAHRQIGTSVLLNYDGVGHGNYYLSPCARAAIETYLTTLETPRPDSHCPAVWPPDGSAGAGPRSGPSTPDDLPPSVGFPHQGA